MTIAVNDAGEMLTLNNGAWQPAIRAQNDKGDMLVLDDGAWKPAPSASPPPSATTFTEYGPSAQEPAPAKPVQGQLGADVNALAQGAVTGTGAAIAGAGRIAQAGQGPSSQRVLAALDLVDAGKLRDAYQGLTDSERQEIGAYRGGTPEDKAAQRAELQQSIQDYSQPNAVTQAGQAVQDFGKQAFPVAPENEGIQTGVARMVGGAAPALAAGAVGGPVGLLGSMAAIGSQAYDGAYQDAIAKGATHEAADDAAGKSAVAQALTMAAPVGRLMQRVPMPLRDGLAATLINLGQHGVEFGSANAIGTFANNYVAQQTYDPTRPLTQGTGQAALEGTIAGLIVPSIGAAARFGATPDVSSVMRAPDVDTAISQAQKIAMQTDPSFDPLRGTAEVPTPDAAVPSSPGAFDWGQLFARPFQTAGSAKGTEGFYQANPEGTVFEGTRIAPDMAPEPASSLVHVDEAGRDLEAPAATPPTLSLAPTTSAAAKDIANAWYQKADQAGGELSPDLTNQFIDAAEKIAPQTKVGQAVAGDTEITKLVDRLQSIRDEPISLQGAQEIYENLGDAISKEYGLQGLSKSGHDLLNLQTTFWNMIQGADPTQIVGGPEGFQAWEQGRDAWAQAMKMADVERIINRANQTDNPATGIKSGVRVLMNSTRIRGFDDAERAALEDAGSRGVIGGLLHVFGSRLIPYAAGAAGAPGGFPGVLAGAAAGYATSTAMRAGATALQNRRINNAMSVLGQGVPAPPAP